VVKTLCIDMQQEERTTDIGRVQRKEKKKR
jgi:hypothetical protein